MRHVERLANPSCGPLLHFGVSRNRRIFPGGWVDPDVVLAAVVTEVTDVLAQVLLQFGARSEEHTSELQSLTNLVCRLLLEKKKKKNKSKMSNTKETSKMEDSEYGTTIERNE